MEENICDVFNSASNMFKADIEMENVLVKYWSAPAKANMQTINSLRVSFLVLLLFSFSVCFFFIPCSLIFLFVFCSVFLLVFKLVSVKTLAEHTVKE